MSITKTKSAKIFAGILGVTLALALFVGVGVQTVSAGALTDAQVQSILGLLSSFGADQSVINNVKASLTGSAPVSAPSAGSYTFTRSLTVGSTGADVKALQQFLNGKGFAVAASGAGSAGNETSTFGPATKAALAKFQAANGISPAVGYFGSLTMAKVNAMGGPVSTVPTTPTTPTTPTAPVGSGLTVSAPVQPSASLAPYNATRVKFTKVTLTASADGDVSVNGVTVERTGLAQDDNFAGVVLIDEDGSQIGIAKTFNSNHQLTLSGPVVVKAGTSKTLTIGGNMAAQATVHAGEVASLTVVSVSANAPVAGVLPITGAAHTINATLSLGTVTMTRGGYDPTTSQTKEIGTTAYTFSSVKVTAGSAEKVFLRSIRWNQTGSASASDMANLKTYVDGVSYDAVSSSDGKYFTSIFPGNGILIDKGFSKDISIKGDIIGGSSRTIDFDIAKRTDIDLMGETYGYGVTPPQTGTSVPTADTAAFSSSEDPWYDAAQVTMSNGTMTVSVDTVGAPATNIAVNAPDQKIAGFTVEVKGEPITVQTMVFTIATSSGTNSSVSTDGLLDNVTLVDANGAVLAGPVDEVTARTVTFSSTVTFPIGANKYYLKGKLPTGVWNGSVFTAAANPSSAFTTVKGVNTGNSITPTPNATLTGSQMTVRSGALSISVSSLPSARSVVAGAQKFEYARYILDATNSGEDARLTNIGLSLSGGATATYLTSCNLYDGQSLTSPIVTQSAVDPSTSNDSDITFTFSGNGLVVPKGTAKTLSLRCNSSSSATSGSFIWGINAQSSYTGVTGVTSGATIAETITIADGQTMTGSSAGTFTVAEDTSLLYKMAQAGASDVVIGRFDFVGATEDIDLKQIALKLAYTASSSPADISNKVKLYKGSVSTANYLGEAQFGGGNPDNATSTLSTPVRLTKGGDSVRIVVTADLGVQDPDTGTPGAFIGVSVDGSNVGINGTYGTGVDSGSTVSSGTTSDQTSDGLRIFRTVPYITVTSNGGTLSASADLYKFTVTNPNSRSVVFQKFTFSLATTGGNVNGFTLYGDSVAFNTSAVTVNSTEGDVLEITASGTSEAQIIPANSSKTYILKASTATDTASVSESVNLALLADTSYPSLANNMGTVTSVELGAANTDNIVWSPFSTTTPVATAATQSNLDWTNGYGMPGFPSNTAFPIQTWTRAN